MKTPSTYLNDYQMLRANKDYVEAIARLKIDIFTILIQSIMTIENATVSIDGKKSRYYKNSMNAYLRLSANQTERTVIEKIKHVDSKSDQLVQLADMIAGAIRRNFENDSPDDLIYGKSLEHIWNRAGSDLWIF